LYCKKLHQKIIQKIASRVVFVYTVKNMKIKHCSAAGNLLKLIPPLLKVLLDISAKHITIQLI